MKKFFPISLFLLLHFTIKAQSGNIRVITDSMTGHVFRPAQIPPSLYLLSSLKLPPGFTISTFAKLSGYPRMLEVTPEGNVYATDREAGTVTLLQDKDNDGKADVIKIVAYKKNMHGIEYRNGKLYLATINDVFVANVHADGTLDSLENIINDLPDAGQHPNRTLHFGPDGLLYISAGSTCNSCDEPENENATILQVQPNGKNRRIYARGLRNTIGFDWHPDTKALWGFDHGIDWLGDNDQPEELNKIKDGANYGWPYVYADGKFDKHHSPPNSSYQEYAAKTTYPEMLYTAHSAPMDLLFYTGSQFPAEYKGDAFVTMHGSWNRKPPSGYKIVRIHFENGKPTQIEDFVTGFLEKEHYTQFARVCGLALYKDGSLLVADDANGVIYRIAYNEQFAQTLK